MNYTNNSLLHYQGVTTDPSLREIVKEAIVSSQLNVDRRCYSIIEHIPASKFAQAKPFLEQQFLPAEGYNASMSHGNWFHPTKRIWVPEPIVLVKSYVTGDVLQQHLGTMLQGYYAMGKALGETAMALELIDNSQMLIIPTE